MQDLSRPKTNNKDHAFSSKWSQETEANGFTQIPNILLTCQGKLNLTYGELVTLVQLISYWFEHSGQIYPSIDSLAKRSNKGYSTTQRHLKSLEEKGFIRRRHVMGSSNKYSLKPCADKLHKHQLTCTLCLKSAEKRGKPIVKVSRPPYSKTTEKEYYPKRLKNNTNRKPSGTSHISSLLANRHFEAEL